MTDYVNSPPHYAGNGIECIDAIKAMLSREEYLGYLRGNAAKYLWRCRNKGNAAQDLNKAVWYQNRLLAELES